MHKEKGIDFREHTPVITWASAILLLPSAGNSSDCKWVIRFMHISQTSLHITQRVLAFSLSDQSRTYLETYKMVR